MLMPDQVDGNKWSLREVRGDGRLISQACAAWPAPGLLNGAVQRDERAIAEGGGRVRLQPDPAFLRFAPENCKCTEGLAKSMAAWKCEAFYTLPMDLVNLAVDEHTHEAFMRVNLCQSRQEVIQALSELGCLCKESPEGSEPVVSLSKLCALMNGLAGVQVLERSEAIFGLWVLCSCPWFIRSGQ